MEHSERGLDYMMQQDQHMLQEMTIQLMLKVKNVMAQNPQAYTNFKNVIRQAASQ